jgi:hypothetical protein
MPRDTYRLLLVVMAVYSRLSKWPDVLAIVWLDAAARTYETINFDQFSQPKNLILVAS